jgi:hypothetical protein
MMVIKLQGETRDSTNVCSTDVIYEDGASAWLAAARRDGPASGCA